MFNPRLSIRLLGIQFAARASSVLVLAVVAGGLLSGLGEHPDGIRPTVAWAAAGVATLVGAVCALAGHEAARAGVWRRSGIMVWRIELGLYGGTAERLGRSPGPRAEVQGALAGLALIVAVAVALTAAALLTRGMATAVHLPLRTLAVAGIAVAALQAMPALPVDGGWVFRAWIWYLTDDAETATRLAVIYARAIAATLVAAGIILLFGQGSTPFWGLAAAVAGWQLNDAVRRTVRGIAGLAADAARPLRDALAGGPTLISGTATVDEAVDLLLADSQEAVLLVVSADGEPVGTLGITNLRGTRRAMWDVLTAGDVMTPLAKLPRLPADLPIAEALLQLEEWPGIAVVEEAGRVVGVVTRTRLLAWSAPPAARDRRPSSA